MTKKNPVLHLLVVGFHHKKGGQVEFSYPPLNVYTKDSDLKSLPENFCPSGWKYLPTLGLPDGAHNYGSDCVYFNLPSLFDPTESLYGVSCYRQIPVEKLKNRTSDLTRSTVQKSVTALLSIPIYGYVEVKLSLIANCFFDQGDFESTDILVKAYEQLNACLLNNDDHLIENLPSFETNSLLSESPTKSRHQSIYHVGLPLRQIILKWRQKLLILFKLMLLQKKVVCFSSPVRPMCELILGLASLHPQLLESGFQQVACVRTSRPLSPMPEFPSPTISTQKEIEENSPEIISEQKSLETEQAEEVKEEEKRSIERTMSRDGSVDALSTILLPLCAANPAEWGAPLPVFRDGNLCLPYLSLPYMDLLTDPSVTGYIIGTSNILFQQKRNLADVLVDVEAAQIEINDLELRKQIQLTTEDLRFVDFVMRHVQNPKEGGLGSDRWIRDQFQGYLIAMLRTTLSTDGNKEHFNSGYIAALTKTNCYSDWLERNSDLNKKSPYDNIPIAHPFAGTLSVQDVRLKFANSIQNTEGGRKLNQAVNTTSKAVGGAISTAKGALTNWWSTFTAPQPQSESIGDSAVEKKENDVAIEDDMEIVGNPIDSKSEEKDKIREE